jgi:translation initiation factor IF-3
MWLWKFFFNFLTTMSKIPKKNQEITAKEVRVVAQTGEMLGVMPLNEAIAKAKMSGLDLLEISPNVVPPVCKIFSFGKYQYDIKKKEADVKHKQHKVLQKEIKMTPNISEHDYQTKMKRMLGFFEDGHRVTVIMQMKGRERGSPEHANAVITKIEKDLDLIAVVLTPRVQSSGNVTISFAPKKTK